jgi:hypothetical protein
MRLQKSSSMKIFTACILLLLYIGCQPSRIIFLPGRTYIPMCEDIGFQAHGLQVIHHSNRGISNSYMNMLVRSDTCYCIAAVGKVAKLENATSEKHLQSYLVIGDKIYNTFDILSRDSISQIIISDKRASSRYYEIRDGSSYITKGYKSKNPTRFKVMKLP